MSRTKLTKKLKPRLSPILHESGDGIFVIGYKRNSRSRKVHRQIMIRPLLVQGNPVVPRKPEDYPPAPPLPENGQPMTVEQALAKWGKAN